MYIRSTRYLTLINKKERSSVKRFKGNAPRYWNRCQRLGRGFDSLDPLQNMLMKIKKMFLKDDIYSHLTEKMYINYCFSYILNND